MCRLVRLPGLVQRSKEELRENFRNYLGQFLETEDTENVLMTNEFLDEQERIVKTEEGEVRKQKKVQQDLLKKKEELAGQLEQGTREFQKLQISLEKRKSQQESILEQLKEQLSGAVFSWLAEDMGAGAGIRGTDAVFAAGKESFRLAGTAEEYSGTETGKAGSTFGTEKTSGRTDQ